MICTALFAVSGLYSVAWAGGIASYELGTPDVGLASGRVGRSGPGRLDVVQEPCRDEPAE